jgi:CBS-domain-containing membrane protein
LIEAILASLTDYCVRVCESRHNPALTVVKLTSRREDAMQAREVMSDGVMSIAADATMLQAAELLVNTRVSAMPVLDNAGTMIGIVSLVDLIGGGRNSMLGSLRKVAGDAREAAAHYLAATTPVTDVMAKNVVTVADDAQLVDVAETMRAHNVKRVPVVREGRVVGIVSRVDILKALISYGTPGEPRPPSVAATDPVDAQLRNVIMNAVQATPSLSIEHIDVVVSGGVAHLWGMAPDDAARRNCDSLVQKIPGVKHVMNHMHVPVTGRS